MPAESRLAVRQLLSVEQPVTTMPIRMSAGINLNIFISRYTIQLN